MTPLPAVLPRLLAAPPAAVPPVPPRAPRCAAPVCGRPAAHRHHAVGRSAQRAHLGKVYDWVVIGDELVLVLVDLCGICHDRLESGWGGCKSRLLWAGGWFWYDRSMGELEPGKQQIILRDQTGIWIGRGFCAGEYRAASLA